MYSVLHKSARFYKSLLSKRLEFEILRAPRISCSFYSTNMDNKFILFDCDTGSDDAIAMMMLLKAKLDKKVEAVAITCVNGNTTLDNAVMNSLRVLKLYDLIDKVPLYKGCNEPLIKKTSLSVTDTGSIHGKDGMGDFPEIEPKSSYDLLEHVRPEHAVTAIIEMSKKYENELTIVATGPLTNIAMAVKLDPQLPRRLKNLYIMGGTREGEGNVTPAAEFNFFVDPEAAYITLNSFPPFCPTILIDFGFCLDYPLPYEWVKKEWLGSDKNQKKVFAYRALQPLMDFYATALEKSALTICDAYAMAMALDPSIVSSSKSYEVCVELSGNCSRGHVVFNKQNRKVDNFVGPVTLYYDFDLEKYMAILINTVM